MMVIDYQPQPGEFTGIFSIGKTPPQELEADVCRDSGTGGFFGDKKPEVWLGYPATHVFLGYPFFWGGSKGQGSNPKNRINEERLKDQNEDI